MDKSRLFIRIAGLGEARAEGILAVVLFCLLLLAFLISRVLQ
jgi:hypothetical protein